MQHCSLDLDGIDKWIFKFRIFLASRLLFFVWYFKFPSMHWTTFYLSRLLFADVIFSNARQLLEMRENQTGDLHTCANSTIAYCQWVGHWTFHLEILFFTFSCLSDWDYINNMQITNWKWWLMILVTRKRKLKTFCLAFSSGKMDTVYNLQKKEKQSIGFIEYWVEEAKFNSKSYDKCYLRCYKANCGYKVNKGCELTLTL